MKGNPPVRLSKGRMPPLSGLTEIRAPSGLPFIASVDGLSELCMASKKLGIKQPKNGGPAVAPGKKSTLFNAIADADNRASLAWGCQCRFVFGGKVNLMSLISEPGP